MSDSKRSHILLVEDEKDTANLLLHYIDSTSSVGETYKVMVFDKARDALLYAKTNSVDLFIIDIQLLDYKGTNLAKQIRAIPEYKYTPIIFQTALAMEELPAYRDIKCYSFLVKPYTKGEFVKIFQEALEMSRQMIPKLPSLQIEQKGFIFEYQLDSILYIEAMGKRVMICTQGRDGRVIEDKISGYSLAKMLELTKEGGMVQCHKSFLVNKQKIWKIDKVNQLIYLRQSELTIPIGNKYHDFMRG